MTTTADRAHTIRLRLRTDMRHTLNGHLGVEPANIEELLDALVDDAMFQIEHLLTEPGDLDVPR